MHFVDNVDLVAPRCGQVAHFFADFADILDARVRGAVDLLHIERVAVRDFRAGGARAAGLAVLGIRAIERLGKEPRHGCLADAARARKDIRVMDAAECQRVHERARDVILTDDIGEFLRPVFSGDDLIGHKLRAIYKLQCTNYKQEAKSKLQFELQRRSG